MGRFNLELDSIGYTVDYDTEGIIGGVYAGYNHQFINNVVIGAEADFQFLGVDSSGVLGVAAGIGTDSTYRFFSEQKWNGSIRAQSGYTADRFLPFVTAGIAFAEYEHGESFRSPFSKSDTYSGWTAGAGVDYAMTDNLIVKAEYRYSHFGSERFESMPLSWVGHTVNLSTHDLRIGVA